MMWWYWYLWYGACAYAVCVLPFARWLFRTWECDEHDTTGALIALVEGLVFPLTIVVIAMLFYITRPVHKKTTKG